MASRWGPFTAFWVVLAAGSAAGAQDIAAQTPAITPLPVATDARIGGDDKETRLIVDLTRKVDVRAFTLADPYRVVVDIPQTVFQLPPKSGDTGRGLIKAYRYGLVMAGGSRIVIDAAKPVRIDKAFVLDAKDGQPARLVLDLVAVDRDSFMRNLALENKTLKPLEIARRNGKDKEPAPQANPDPRPIVVVDPGHGGPDTGAKAAGGEMEKDIVLEFSFCAARPAREIRQIPRGHDAHRRHLHSAQRARETRAPAAGLALYIRACRLGAEGGRRACRERPSTRCRTRPPTAKPRGWPRPRTSPT